MNYKLETQMSASRIIQMLMYLMVFIFYSDVLVIDLETGMVTKQIFNYNSVMITQ